MAERAKDPSHYAAGYSLDLYCDSAVDSWKHRHCSSYYGQTFAQCAKDARSEGWVIHKDRTATCPVCLKVGRFRRKVTESGLSAGNKLS
jgi:hypothetical protein